MEFLRAFYRRLNRNGVDLVAITDGIQTTHQMAKLQITIKGLVNELYLDDLRDKVHRGMTGLALRGLSTGGRLFGYRTARGPQGAEWTISEPEAAIVRRIFQIYADGHSMKAIAAQLNEEGIPFPAKVTRRGPSRRGWAVSTIHTILMNEKYRGRWVWNKTMFVKDPETGKRTALARPKSEWVMEERPALAIVEGALWQRVQERLQRVRAAYGATSSYRRPRGQAPQVYSPYVLSGLMRCGVCGAKITVQTSQGRKANGRVYRYGRYRCSFHVTKGPAVCGNSMSLRQDVLEAKLLGKFRDALTPDMINYLVVATNDALAALQDQTPRELEGLAEERQRIDRELSNLVAFVATGDLSPRVGQEIRAREQRLAELDRDLERLVNAGLSAPLQVDRAWVADKVQHLAEVLASDPVGARRELQKHIEELRITPVPETGARVMHVTGRGKLDGLLGTEEAVRLQLVAGAGFAECYTTATTHWIDLI